MGGRSRVKAAGKPKAKGKPKYNAKGRHVEGHWCASDAEAARCEQLLAMERKGMIANLEMQPRYDLKVNTHQVATLRVDFRYDVIVEGDVVRHVVEELKGMQTPEFKLKWKLFDALMATPLTVISPGRKNGSRSEFMHLHWTDMLPPEGHNHWKTPFIKK